MSDFDEDEPVQEESLVDTIRDAMIAQLDEERTDGFSEESVIDICAEVAASFVDFLLSESAG